MQRQTVKSIIADSTACWEGEIEDRGERSLNLEGASGGACRQPFCAVPIEQCRSERYRLSADTVAAVPIWRCDLTVPS